MGVGALEDVGPAAKHGKAIHQRILAAGEIRVQYRQNFFVEPDAGGGTPCPSTRRASPCAGGGARGRLRPQRPCPRWASTHRDHKDTAPPFLFSAGFESVDAL